MSLRKWDELGQLSRELNIYQKLGERIGQVYIYSYGKNEECYVKEYPNVNVISRFWFLPDKCRGQKYINVLYNLISVFFRYGILRKVDIIKTNQLSGADYGTWLKKLFRKKLIIRMGYYHTLDRSRFSSDEAYQNTLKVEKKVFPQADRVIVTNPHAKNFICNNYYLSNSVIQYIPNSIDTDLFKPYDMKKCFEIMFVGRFIGVKNLHNLLKAVMGLKLRILFIGKGALRQDLIKFADKNGLEVSIVDKVDNKELPLYYNKSKIFILPSFYEGNPKTLLEAMACGCACIGTDVNGINNIIRHKVNGYLCKTDEGSIKAAIVDAISNNSLRKTMGENAREFIKENYSLEKLIEKETASYMVLS